MSVSSKAQLYFDICQNLKLPAINTKKNLDMKQSLKQYHWPVAYLGGSVDVSRSPGNFFHFQPDLIPRLSF